uniref:Uncharacterized protein n=1 Tax=Oryza glumipatula TaxID=40148 RepID=A0A0E0A716_9ORYZ
MSGCHVISLPSSSLYHTLLFSVLWASRPAAGEEAATTRHEDCSSTAAWSPHSLLSTVCHGIGLVGGERGARIPLRSVLRCCSLSHAWAAALSSDAFIDHYLRLAKRRRGPKLCILPESAFADTVSAWSPETPAKAATTSSGKIAAAASGRRWPGKSCRCWAWAALEELGWRQRRSRRPPRRRPPDLLSRLAPAGLVWLFLIYFGKQTVGEDAVRRDSANKEDEWMQHRREGGNRSWRTHQGGSGWCR